MADIFTSDEIDQQIADYKAALRALSVTKEYSIGSRRYTRADMQEIRSTLEWLVSEKTRMENGAAPGPVSSNTVPVR